MGHLIHGATHAAVGVSAPDPICLAGAPDTAAGGQGRRQRQSPRPAAAASAHWSTVAQQLVPYMAARPSDGPGSTAQFAILVPHSIQLTCGCVNDATYRSLFSWALRNDFS